MVAPLPGGGAERAIVRAVARLAADLGVQCTAEGIETAGKRDLLAEPGVRGQGYGLTRPTGARECRALIEEQIRG